MDMEVNLASNKKRKKCINATQPYVPVVDMCD